MAASGSRWWLYQRVDEALGEGLGLECPVGLFTRPERVIVLVLGLLLGQLTVAQALITLLSLATAAQRFLYLRRAARR